MTITEPIIKFYNCSILRDHKIIKDDLWVCNKKIVNPEPLFFEEKVLPDIRIDCKGFLIAPGFIDVQLNGGFGYDFSYGSLGCTEKAVDTVAKGVLPHGVTSFCPTLITSPSHKYQQIIPLIKKRNGSQLGAGILGIHLEGPFINKEKKGAHPVQYIRNLDSGFSDILDAYENLENVAMLTLAPELDVTGQVIKELSRRGITVSLGHSMGNLSDGEQAVKRGASFITHLFNAMLPFHHRDPGLVGLLTTDQLPPGRTVFFGIIADGIHTHPAALRIAYRSNPKGLVLVTDGMSAMGLNEGSHRIGEQVVEIVDNKALIAGTGTLAGSIATMDKCVQYFKQALGCSPVEALECATLHPAQALGIVKTKGTLDFESDADFIILDDNLNIKATFIDGECVWCEETEISIQLENLKSLCK